MQRAYAKREVFAFSVLSAEKGKNIFLCVLRASSPRRYLRGRAVRYKLVHTMKNLTQILRSSFI